jgi:hypothetical protein
LQYRPRVVEFNRCCWPGRILLESRIPPRRIGLSNCSSTCRRG